MAYKYYGAGAFDRNRFRKSIEGSLELSRFRLNPSLDDVDSLIFLLRKAVLSRWFADLPSGLILLDIGGRIQPYRKLLEKQLKHYIALDLQLDGLVNVVAAAETLPIRDSCCDVVLSTDALQYIPDPAEAIRESHRVLRPGGRLILSTRGNYPEHHDELWRFLPDGLRYMARMFSSVEIVREGRTGSGLAITANVLLHRNIRSSVIKAIAKKTTIPIINKMGLLLDRLMPQDFRSTCGLSMLAIK
jgi:SAM-dependent methyltransferase